jgi:predicted protein tyrosine phosphatase
MQGTKQGYYFHCKATMSSKEKLENVHMGQIVPGVWIGSLAALSHLDESRNWTIVTIISSNQMLKVTNDVIFQSNVPIKEHIVWILQDHAQAELLSEVHLNRIFSILDDASTHEACLIHCAKGSSRSVSACVAWLLYSRKFDTLEAAMTRVRRVKKNANPNLGFLASLHALEQCNGNVSKARERMVRVSQNCNGEEEECPREESRQGRLERNCYHSRAPHVSALTLR